LAYTVPTVEPTEFTAGDSLEWDRTLGDYTPSDGWTLSYVLTGAHASVISISATANDGNTGHEVRVTPATTAAYTDGRYNLVGLVTHTDGRRFEVYRAACFVYPNPATETPELSFNERMLAAVEAKIATRITADISRYTLEQQEVHREELATLNRQRNSYADAVRRERGGGFFQTAKVKYGAPA
jgi:hypothetical protein